MSIRFDDERSIRERIITEMSNTKTKKNPASKKTVLYVIIAIVIAAAIIGLAIYNAIESSGLTLRGKTVLKTDHFKVDGAMFSYLYNTQYQNLYSALSQLGVDTSKSLKTQQCPFFVEGQSGSWFDYFVDRARSEASNLLALCEAAHSAGVSLTSEDLKTVDDYGATLDATAKGYGYANGDKYLQAVTGNPITVNDVKECLKLSALASKYSSDYTSGFGNTAEEFEKYYEENKATFDGVDFYSWSFDATTTADKVAEATANAEEGTEVSEDEIRKELADAMAKIGSVEEFTEMLKAEIHNYLTKGEDETEEDYEARCDTMFRNSFTEHAVKSSLNTEVGEWAFAAQAGDTFVYNEEGSSTYTVYMLSKEAYRQEDLTRSVRHILFSSSKYTDDTTVNSVYAELESAGFTDEKFAELAAQYSDDTGSSSNGGLYENVKKGQMIAEFNDWLFDPERKPGDHGIVKAASTGWHIMYYVGEGELKSWESDAQTAIRNAAYDKLIEDNSGSIKYDASAASSING